MARPRTFARGCVMHRDDEEVEPGVVTEGPFVPVRTRVRAAVEAAWRTAEERGALPPIDIGRAGAGACTAATGDGAVTAATPAVEVERPANPDHGDLASNLALKLARPLRRSPL